jgi:MFS family permease
MPDTIGVDANRYPLYRWVILACVSLSICACSMAMTGIAPILETIAEDLGVPVGTAANLMLAYVLAISLFFPLAGMICDRYGLTAALVSGLLCSCIPAVIMPCLATYRLNTFICLRFIQGASVAFVLATLAFVLAHWFPNEERGVASALMSGAMPVGSSIGVLTTPYLLDLTGSWQRSISMVSIVGWVSIVLAFLFTRSPVPSAVLATLLQRSTTQKEMSFVRAMTLPQTWVGVCIMFCNAWCLFCLYNIIPTFLSTSMPVGAGMPSTLAGKLSLFVTLSGFFAMTAGGILIDRVVNGKYHLAMCIGFFMTAIANFSILIPEFQKNQFLLALALFVAGCGMPFMSASISYYLVSRYSAAIVGRMMGVWYGVGTLGGAMGIYLAGVSIIKSGNFHWAILQISIAAIMGFVFSWLLPVIDTAGRKLDYATSV